MINVLGNGAGISRMVKATSTAPTVDLVRVQFSSIGTVKIPHNLSGREETDGTVRFVQANDKPVPISGNPKKSA